MKKNVLKFGLVFAILLGIVSCKDEKQEMADKKIKTLETYIDSLKMVKTPEVVTNWDIISKEYDRKSGDANEALAGLNDEQKTKSQPKMEAVKTKFNDVKNAVDIEKDKAKVAAKPNPKQILRNRFFGEGKIGEDMNFSWVNKDNILKTYDAFFEAYKANKANFSREDYDEVKLIYEALDSRKNTVEKEGLTSVDNRKIASIKFKFAPMFKINRMGAKSREAEKAKE